MRKATIAVFPKRVPRERVPRERVRVGARFTPSNGDSGTIARLFVVDDDGATIEVEAALPIEVRGAVVVLDDGGWLLLGCVDGLVRAPAPH